MDENEERLRLEVGKHLKAMRKKAKLTQVEMSQKTGIVQPNISEMENGKRLPQLDTLVTFAKALGVTLDAMVPPFDPNEAGE